MLYDRYGPAGHVHHRADQRLVQRHQRVAVPADPGAIAQRPRERQAEGDAGVLDGVVAVNVEIALGLDREVEQRVPGQRLEHVVEEADPGTHVRPRPARRGRPARGGRSPWSSAGSLPPASAPAFASQPRIRSSAAAARLHVVRRADGNPEAFRQLGRGRDVANQDAIFLEQPPEHLPRGHALAPDQDEVGRARIEREPRRSRLTRWTNRSRVSR